MELKQHWKTIYKRKSPSELSWYQERPEKSLALIRAAGVDSDVQILDAGGGASRLVDHLLAEGFRHLSVLDISAKAFAAAKARLRARAKEVTWMEGDVTRMPLPESFYDLWHDRAVFHFLTGADDRRRYVDAVLHALKPKGHLIIATFALDGPSHCSGLDVVRYSPETLHREIGAGFRLLESTRETHQTPFGTRQEFIYCLFQKA